MCQGSSEMKKKNREAILESDNDNIIVKSKVDSEMTAHNENVAFI